MPRMTIKEHDAMPPEQVLAQRGRNAGMQAPEDPYSRVVSIIAKGKVAEILLADVRGESATRKAANVRSAVRRRIEAVDQPGHVKVRRSRNEKSVFVALVQDDAE